MKRRPQLKSTSHGFTIIELLVVIVVIGILTGVSAVAYNGVRDRANAAATEADISNISKKLNIYLLENQHLPTDINAMQNYGMDGIVNKMTVIPASHSTVNADIPKGEYAIDFFGTTSNGGLNLVYFDYTQGSWMQAGWRLHEGDVLGWDSRRDSFYVNDDGSGEPCTRANLRDCAVTAIS